MILHRFPSFVYAALTVAALAFASGPAWAQKGGGHGGGHGGGGHKGHGGGEHWGGGGWGGGYGYGGYGYGYYPYGGFGRGLFWGGYPYYGSRGYYDYYPYDYGYNYAPDYSVPSYSQAAPAPRVNIPENAALIDVRVPDGAQVWIDGQPTKQTGPMRELVTPALDPGQEFSYDIRARWTENGQQVDRHRKVTFHAGDRLMVNLMAPQGSPSAEARQ